MTDFEDRLRDVLQQHATPVVPPPAPIDLARQVRRRRRRYRAQVGIAGATAAAVIVGAVVVGATQVTRDHQGQPAYLPISIDDTLGVCTRTANYPTGMTQTVNVYFDGTHASYDGPTQVRSGTKITFHVISILKDTAVAVGDIPDTVTCEQAFRDAVTGKYSQPPDYLTNIDWQAGDLTVTLTRGRHEVVVGTPPEPTGTDKAALAAIIQAS